MDICGNTDLAEFTTLSEEAHPIWYQHLDLGIYATYLESQGPYRLQTYNLQVLNPQMFITAKAWARGIYCTGTLGP